MKTSPLMVLVLLAACAKPQPSPPDGPVAQKLTGSPCTVPVHEADSLSWREVQAEGFAFCVPGDWEQSGNGGWRGDGGSLSWGLGNRHRSTSVVFAPGGTVLGRSTTGMPPAVRRYTETIGGESATITESRIDAAQLTTATWPKRKLWFEGKSGSSRDAERQLAVYRTVHFNGPGAGQ